MATVSARAAWSVLTAPAAATFLHGLAIWLWHAPPIFESALAGSPIRAIEGEAWDAMAHCDLALAASGTVTVEAALLGAPMVTDQGNVVGVVLRESPRRGRIYTSTPETAAKLAATSPHTPDFEAGDTLTKRNYGIVADTLRREYRVAEVGCIKS